jgi:hypothetical protein
MEALFMEERQVHDFLIRNMPAKLYNLLEEAAKAHNRSKTQEAIVALTNGLQCIMTPLTKPKPFKWGKQPITNRFIQDAIDEGRE